MRMRTLPLALLVAAALPATAADRFIELDPELTAVTFRLKATLHTVHGSAAAAAGSLRLDTDSGAMAGAVTVDATTAETGNGKRDKKMHRKVLRTADYPQIVLRARRLEGELARQGASEVTLHGEMEILGQPHEIAIPLRVEIDGDHFTATAEFEVPYVEWGLDNPSTFVLRVAKKVFVTVAAEGSIRSADPTPKSRSSIRR